MSRRNGPSFDPTLPENRRGLSIRLAEKAIAKADETPRLFLPVFRPKQIPDQLVKGEK